MKTTKSIQINWKKKLKALKYEYIKKTSPGFFDLSGGYEMKLKAYNDSTTNGLTKCIIDWINYNGGNANRINVQGQVIIERLHLAFGKYCDNVKRIPSSTNKGTADIHAIYKGRHISIEIKIGRDKLSENQMKEMERVTQAGGLYFIARNMQGFVDWWEDIQ